MIGTVDQAKMQLAKLNAVSLTGETAIVSRRSTAVARLIPIAAAKPKRVYGAFTGQFDLTDAFFEPLPQDEIACWQPCPDLQSSVEST